jgi:cytochrome c oxidase subunit III
MAEPRSSEHDVVAPVHADHFEDMGKQEHAMRLGMWLFLGSEVLLFAGLFALYASYRAMYGEDFKIAEQHNDPFYGTLNTFILITSSFTVAMSIYFVRNNKRGMSIFMLFLTVLFGLGFMGVKAVEYTKHFNEGIFPGIYYHCDETLNGHSLNTFGARTFYTLYYFMTGLHALHVIIGLTVLIVVGFRVRAGKYSSKYYVGLELGGLYWHLVDLIWIYLWPLLYLTRW